MAEQGWIKLHRCIKSNWVWNDKPFSRGEAFLDLLLMVNHEDKKIIFNGSLIEIKRGSGITSLRKLSDRWEWSTKKVKHFLEQLQNDQMVTYESDKKKTLVSIENYDLYQGKEILKVQKSNSEELEKKTKGIIQESLGKPNKNDRKNIKNNKELTEKKEVLTTHNISFPSLVHQLIFDNFGEVGYRTWFIDAVIIDTCNVITIIVDAEYKRNIMQDKYLIKLELLTGKKIRIELAGTFSEENNK